MIDESDKYSFYFVDICVSALGILFFLTCESIVLNLFSLKGQGVVGEVIDR